MPKRRPLPQQLLAFSAQRHFTRKRGRAVRGGLAPELRLVTADPEAALQELFQGLVGTLMAQLHVTV